VHLRQADLLGDLSLRELTESRSIKIVRSRCGSWASSGRNTSRSSTRSLCKSEGRRFDPAPGTRVIDYSHWTGEFTLQCDRDIFSYLAPRGARRGRSAMSDTTGSANTEPDPATADNPPSDIKAGDQARDPEGSAAHRSDQRDAGISDDDVPAGDQGG